MAEKVLSKARTGFVERVTKVVIDQLLDGLLEARVLNDGEVEEVREGKQTRANKARCLIDMVQRKGDGASTTFITLLEERDSNLYTVLSLGTVAPPTPAPAAEVKQSGEEMTSVSPVLIPSTEDFKKHILQKEGNSIYRPMEKQGRKRLALLINNVKFDQVKMLRRGAEKDEENMKTLLEGLDYRVINYRDLSALDMDKAVREFSQCEEHLQSDSTILVIMSHGQRDAILGIHHENEGKPDIFKIDKIFNHLNTKNCDKLRNKPKIILIQACRGEESGSAWVSDSVSTPDSAIEDDHIREDHKEKDFISLLSCTPDTKSYRHVEEGTFFIQHVVETFNTNAHEDHVEELFRKVKQKFENFPKQMPTTERGTLTKHFYLFPGL